MAPADGPLLRAADPVKHVIHTNFGNLNSYAEVDGLPEMELVSTNTYAVKDIAQIAEVWTKRLLEEFHKPYMLSEYGIGHNVGSGGYAGHDPERVMVHDGLWSPLLSGSAGTGMAWDWNWLDDDHFYRYIQAVAQVVKDIPFSRALGGPCRCRRSSLRTPRGRPYYADAFIEGFPGNYTFPPEARDRSVYRAGERTAGPAGLALRPAGKPQAGQARAKSFQVRYPADGQFIVYVPELSGGSKSAPRLTVSVDGTSALEQELRPEVCRAVRRSGLLPEVPGEIPAGSHTIRVANIGGGSITTAFESRTMSAHGTECGGAAG